MTEQKTGTQIARVPEQETHLPADPMIMLIEKVVKDPEADISKLEKMLEMRERIEDRAREDRARQAERAFFAALTAAQNEVPLVVRTRANTFAKYTYADLADIETQAMPVVRRHGFSVSAWSGAGAERGYQRVFMRVSHVDGHSHEIHDDFPLDGAGAKGASNKTDIQAKGSTTSYGRRYLLCGYFSIATADDDGSRRHAEPAAADTISAKDAARVRELIASTDTEEAKFLGVAKSESIEEIPAKDAARLIGMLERKSRDQAKVAKESGNA